MYATNHLHPRLARNIKSYCKAKGTSLTSIGFVTIEMKKLNKDRIDYLEAYAMIRSLSLKDLHGVPLLELTQMKRLPIVGALMDLWEMWFHK